MKEYHKIQTMFKREQERPCRIIHGQWTLPEFEYLKDNEWVFTEKVDGTNIRVMWDGATVKFGGRTNNASIPAFLYEKLALLFPEALMREAFPARDGVQPMVCLYGEGYGARIQKGGGNYIKDGVSFALFDVDINGWWLQRMDVNEIAARLDIRYVPIVAIGTLAGGIKLVQQGFKSSWGDFTAEGIVARPATELRTRRGDRIITKIKHVDFAL